MLINILMIDLKCFSVRPCDILCKTTFLLSPLRQYYFFLCTQIIFSIKYNQLRNSKSPPKRLSERARWPLQVAD